MSRAVVFDLDGTLLSFDRPYDEILRKTFEAVDVGDSVLLDRETGASGLSVSLTSTWTSTATYSRAFLSCPVGLSSFVVASTVDGAVLEWIRHIVLGNRLLNLLPSLIGPFG